MSYTIDPGLYALGQPETHSPVLVTANYKLTFDHLREALPDLSAWILVLDTRGINVWCAAGKGTFGTQELVNRIQMSGLEKLVNHRQLILPQLGAPGIAAHEVRKLSGFKVIYGPIQARDLPSFLDSGFQATPEMRTKAFSIRERLVLIPIELVGALKSGLLLAAAFFFLAGFGGSQGYWANAASSGSFAALALLSSILSGAVLSPLLLPWLPGRAFSLKGMILGFAMAVLVTALRGLDPSRGAELLEGLAWLLIIPAGSAFLAMNFTGASTYTSLSGVRREMRWAVPLEIIFGALGLLLWLTSRLMA